MLMMSSTANLWRWSRPRSEPKNSQRRVGDHATGTKFIRYPGTRVTCKRQSNVAPGRAPSLTYTLVTQPTLASSRGPIVSAQ
jgi:hypothetical protein